jgi:hypothetical protein
MGGFIVQCDGKMVTMPFEGNWMVSKLQGPFPNEVVLTMDEDRFQSGFVEHANTAKDRLHPWPIAARG